MTDKIVKFETTYPKALLVYDGLMGYYSGLQSEVFRLQMLGRDQDAAKIEDLSEQIQDLIDWADASICRSLGISYPRQAAQ
jgi:hypothetical protein